MFNSQQTKQVFKHPIVVTVIAMVLVAIITSYLTMAQASIPRSEVQQMIQKSEDRQDKAVDKLDKKEDLILEKIEDLQVKVGILSERVKGK